MKATIHFDLPDEDIEFKVASNAMSWALAMWDLDQAVRGKLKYGNTFINAEAALEWVRNEIYEVLQAKAISLDIIV
jgi:hypothetical protein